MKLLAHIIKNNDIRYEQTLKEHCFKTAEYATESLKSTGFSQTAYLAGLVHDMGKGKKEYIEYLEAAACGKDVKRGSVNHTFAAVIFLFEKYHAETSSIWERLTCEIISYAVGAHHGMFDCVDLDGKNGFSYRLGKNRTELGYQESLDNFFAEVASEKTLDECFKKATKEIQIFFEETKSAYGANNGNKCFFQVSMLARLILSAVMYGDRRDTGEFMRNENVPEKQKTDWQKYTQYFEDKIKDLGIKSELNDVRKNISEQCFIAAKQPKGIYKLNVPTGAGKTLCSLRYALTHAAEYGKKRIIFIIPLLGVLDQNVRVIREYVPFSDKVQEYHSNVIQENNMSFGQDLGETLDRFELLTDDWSKPPIIVTTLVQFLNILFTSQTSSAVRMQALCDSVIVFDEVQSVPKKVTAMFNQALNFLEQFCNTTIVLSSATQPCFDELKWNLRLSKEPDIVHLNQQQMQVFKRAEIMDMTDKEMDINECASFCCKQMEKYSSLLVICNTKSETRKLYMEMKEIADREKWGNFHLSTAMCQRHRLDKLSELQDGLFQIQAEFKKGKRQHRLACISTQLMEAGIDISFECVVRVMAGVDNLAQASGRCNRGNEYGRIGTVYLIRLKNENLGMLREIIKAKDSTIKVLEYAKNNNDNDYIGETLTRKFYRYLYQEIAQEIKYPVKDNKGNTVMYLADLLSNINESAAHDKKSLLHQPFKTAGNEFKVFDQDTVDILVQYGEGEKLAEQLFNMHDKPFNIADLKPVLKMAKQYMVSIYDWQKKILDDKGLIFWLFEGRIAVLDKQAYNEDYGLFINAAQSVEDFIF